ncbi:hypothetical protein GFS31_43810 (plasmid) [Leptolyngbya sp. BL0902]|nr:hypothetical protein GFS31_43810 [Leptolyngbya sp. BL0902]
MSIIPLCSTLLFQSLRGFGVDWSAKPIKHGMVGLSFNP